jgi:hypothetical protein
MYVFTHTHTHHFPPWALKIWWPFMAPFSLQGGHHTHVTPTIFSTRFPPHSFDSMGLIHHASWLLFLFSSRSAQSHHSRHNKAKHRHSKNYRHNNSQADHSHCEHILGLEGVPKDLLDGRLSQRTIWLISWAVVSMGRSPDARIEMRVREMMRIEAIMQCVETSAKDGRLLVLQYNCACSKHTYACETQTHTHWWKIQKVVL